MLKKLTQQALKMARKKATKKPTPAPKKTSGSPLKARTPVKKPAVRYSPGGKGKSAKAKPIGQMGLRKKKPVKKQSSNDYVMVSNKFYKDEEKFENMARAGKKLTDAQLKRYSKAVKMTTDYAAEIDGTMYNTRNHRDKVQGTVAHALDDLKSYLPKKYMDLYKKK
jgi:hypothetical protein|tara:strand:- start:78 stop:575 length:498 start_codon:yes stop_codon:yes gene_type:complete